MPEIYNPASSAFEIPLGTGLDSGLLPAGMTPKKCLGYYEALNNIRGSSGGIPSIPSGKEEGS
jgi:hypothetical protein